MFFFCPKRRMSLLSLLLAATLFVLPLSSSGSAVVIGATYTSSSSGGGHISAAVTALGLDAVRLTNPDPAAVHAFLYSNTTLLLTLPNALVPAVAANRSAASEWAAAILLPFFPRAKISGISVGDASLLDSAPAFAVLAAARNLRLALSGLGMRGIFVSATFSAASLVSPFFPPSAAQIRHLAAVDPLLQFLAETGSPLMVALQPYHTYRANPEIPVGFALFQDHPFNFRDDPGSGVRYRSLFEAMAGAVSTALAAAGHAGMPVVVAETGWPAGSPDPAEVDANAAYAQLYVKGLVRHLRSSGSAGGVAAAYVYELLDGGGEDNRSWGILDHNLTSKYEVDFSGGPQLLIKTHFLGWLVFCFLAVF